jgi:hypothetical protein
MLCQLSFLFKDGHVILGLADGLVGSVVRFYKVLLNCTANSILCVTSVLLQLPRIVTSNAFAHVLTLNFMSRYREDCLFSITNIITLFKQIFTS